MSSKKKMRYKAYTERQKKKEQEKARAKRHRDILRDGTMKEIANELGVPLE